MHEGHHGILDQVQGEQHGSGSQSHVNHDRDQSGKTSSFNLTRVVAGMVVLILAVAFLLSKFL